MKTLKWRAIFSKDNIVFKFRSYFVIQTWLWISFVNGQCVVIVTAAYPLFLILSRTSGKQFWLPQLLLFRTVVKSAVVCQLSIINSLAVVTTWSRYANYTREVKRLRFAKVRGNISLKICEVRLTSEAEIYLVE